MRGTKFAVVLLFALGCKAAQVRPDQLAMARLEAVAKAHAQDTQYVVRWNPAPCECPPFEVLLDNVWYRVFLEPQQPSGPVEKLQAELEEAGAKGDIAATRQVTGHLSKGVRLAKTRAPCLVLKIVEQP